MKKIIFTLVFLICGITNCNSQINNLKDLLEISELNVEEMVSELQGIWKLNPPVQDTSEKGFITERYIFSYNRDNKKQVLKKCGRMDMSTSQTIWLTNFVSNDKELLNRITKNLVYQGFELKGKMKSNSMYEDGNRIVTIQTESDVDYKLPNGCYSINVIVNKKINGGYLQHTEKKTEKSKNKGTNDALNSISNKKETLSTTPESKYFEYLSNLNSYSPKVSSVCEDQGYSDCFRDVTSFVKELAELRTIHLKNKDNENYLKFYKTKTAIAEKRNWNEDAKNIDKYIVENINIYEKTLKECGYDDLDWFKKLPKDLYHQFNLNKAEILEKH